MIDIVETPVGEDMKLVDAIVAKAGNVASIQIGDLEYAQEFGVDMRFFLESEFQFQNESFKAYIVQRLAEHQVNVAQVIDTVDVLFQKYTYIVGDVRATGGGLIL